MKSPLRFFHPVLKASNLGRKPVRVQVGDLNLVLFRDEKGAPAALEDRCAHRFAQLSAGSVRDGKIHCPYHDWRFDSAGAGFCPSQPSLKPKPVASYQVRERYGCLWVAVHGVSEQGLPQFREDLHFVTYFDIVFEAPLHVVLANFSEDEHLPYVHHELGWFPQDWDQVQFRAENFPDRTEVQYSGPQKVTPSWRLFGLKSGDIFHNEWKMYFDPPRATYDFHWTARSGQRRSIVFSNPIYFVPEGAKRTRLHVFSLVKLGKLPAWAIALMTPFLRYSGRREMIADQKFMSSIADTPVNLTGMSLGRFDKPIIHNQRLLQQIYFGQSIAKEVEPPNSMTSL